MDFSVIILVCEASVKAIFFRQSKPADKQKRLEFKIIILYDICGIVFRNLPGQNPGYSERKCEGIL